jgi:DNA polymerase-3 subunit delta'
MRFQDIVGQTDTIKTLKHMVGSNHLPHALLLLGPNGIGKRTLALALSQYLLCTNRTDDDSCGECAACSKTAKLIHPDVHFSFPVVGAGITSDKFMPLWRQALHDNPYMDSNQWLQFIGAENKQGNINKDDSPWCWKGEVCYRLMLVYFSRVNKRVVLDEADNSWISNIVKDNILTKYFNHF